MNLIPPIEEKDKDKLHVIWDLDETLMQCRYDEKFLRPYAREALNFTKENCINILWTAATEECFDGIKDILDPKNDSFHFKIFRDDSWNYSKKIKDLRLLNRDMNKIIIIENSIECVDINRLNCIIVSDYEGINLFDDNLFVVLCMIKYILDNPHLSVPEFCRTSLYNNGYYVRLE